MIQKAEEHADDAVKRYRYELELSLNQLFTVEDKRDELRQRNISLVEEYKAAPMNWYEVRDRWIIETILEKLTRTKRIIEKEGEPEEKLPASFHVPFWALEWYKPVFGDKSKFALTKILENRYLLKRKIEAVGEYLSKLETLPAPPQPQRNVELAKETLRRCHAVALLFRIDSKEFQRTRNNIDDYAEENELKTNFYQRFFLTEERGIKEHGYQLPDIYTVEKLLAGSPLAAELFRNDRRRQVLK